MEQKTAKKASALYVMILISFLIIANPLLFAQGSPEARAVFYVQ
ncbi:hypothetical protein [Desulfospira joergensenii]|nr:hypothetical protein [Desulfospira joergensenii]